MQYYHENRHQIKKKVEKQRAARRKGVKYLTVSENTTLVCALTGRIKFRLAGTRSRASFSDQKAIFVTNVP